MTGDLIWLPGMISLVLAVVSGRVMIPWLTRMKFGQAIRSDGPRKHLSKAGTPTMGGLIFLFPVILLAVLPGSGVSYPVTFSLLGFGFLGYLDDILKIRRRRSEGLTPGQKMTGQLLLSVAITLLVFQGTAGGDLYFFQPQAPPGGWLAENSPGGSGADRIQQCLQPYRWSGWASDPGQSSGICRSGNSQPGDRLLRRSPFRSAASSSSPGFSLVQQESRPGVHG